MAPSSFRVLKRNGRITLVETANPALGIGYSVRDGSLGLWAGIDKTEAERQFDLASADG